MTFEHYIIGGLILGMLAWIKLDLRDMRNENNKAIADLRNESKEAFADLRNESKEAFADLRNESQEAVANLKKENREAFAGLRNENNKATADLKNDHSNLLSYVMAIGERLARVEGKLDLITSRFSITIDNPPE